MALQDIIERIRQKPDRLGLEIDARSIKIVRLKRVAARKFEVMACGVCQVPPKKATSVEQQRLSALVKQLCGGLNRVALSIDDQSLRIRRMTFPKMPTRDLMEAIKWNFREHIDCPLEEYTVGFTPIRGWQEGDHLLYSAYGVSRRAINEHLEIARTLNLKPVALEPKATALLAAFDNHLGWQPKQLIVGLLLGGTATHFVVLSQGQLLFSRPLPAISLEVLARHLAHHWRVDESAAQEKLDALMNPKEGAASQDVTEDVDVDAFRVFYRNLLIEVQRSIDAFCLLFNVESVDRIYLCGAGAYCPGIVEHMQKSLGIRTAIFNPFENIEDEKLGPVVKRKAAVYAVAYGLAIP